MALLLNMSFIGRGILRSVVLIPWAMAPVTVGILWGWVFDGGYGTLNALLFDLGLTESPVALMGDTTWAFHILAFVHVWNQAPLTTLLLLAGLQSMPDNLHRAARIDGAGAVARFFRITLPWLKPMLLMVMILTTINSIMAFDVIWTMTKGGPGSATTTVAWLGYAEGFQVKRFGEGAAILFLLSFACLVLGYVYLRLFAAGEKRRAALVAAAPATAVGRAGRLGTLTLPAPRLPKLSAATRRRLGRIGTYVAAVGAFVWSAGPFVMLIIMSLSPASDLVRSPPTLLPASLTFENYQFVLFPTASSDVGATVGQSSVQATRVPRSILNSVIVAAAVTVINVILGTIAGYAYSRSRQSRLMNSTLWVLMMTRMAPSLALILPFFILFRTFGLIDTKEGLIIAYCSLILPLSTWMMKGYFDGLPQNLERAARVDGCSRLGTLWKIVRPIATPGIIAAAIFCFLVSWNEFVFALILTSTTNSQTIPVIISGFLAQLRFYDFGPMFAASVLAVIPPVFIVLVFQRYLVRGMLAGSIKG
jgi:ABC-type glycerol-3-phosphate transport system permease component